MATNLNYVIMLPLQEMTLNRIAIILWNKPDIFELIEQLPTRSRGLNSEVIRKSLERKVRDKIPELGLPEPLFLKLIPVLKPIGPELIRWKLFHQEYLEEKFGIPVLEKLLWTSTGAVDYRNTAAALVRSDVLGIEGRYQLACLYCLQDCIPELWNELPEESKNSFYSEKYDLRTPEPPMHLCWPYILKGEESKLADVPGYFDFRNRRYKIPRGERFHLSSFRYSSFRRYKSAAEYCFQNLTVEERKAPLVETAVRLIRSENRSKFCSENLTRAKTSDMLCYLLSQMTPEEQMTIFKKRPCEVLRCFMEWPWHHLFSDIADAIWDLIPAIKYKELFCYACSIIKKFGYYVPSVLQNLLRRSPSEFGKLFAEKSYQTIYFLEEIFDNQDTVTLKIIFGNLDHAHRAKLVLDPCVLRLLREYNSKGDSRMVEACIREAALTEKETKALRKFPANFQSLPPYLKRLAGLADINSDSSSEDSWSEDASNAIFLRDLSQAGPR